MTNEVQATIDAAQAACDSAHRLLVSTEMVKRLAHADWWHAKRDYFAALDRLKELRAIDAIKAQA